MKHSINSFKLKATMSGEMYPQNTAISDTSMGTVLGVLIKIHIRFHFGGVSGIMGSYLSRESGLG